MVSLRNIVEIDPSVSDLADLRIGWSASRASREDGWIRTKMG